MLLPFRPAHYASTVVKLRNSTGNSLTILGGKSVTHYTETLIVLCRHYVLASSRPIGGRRLPRQVRQRAARR